MGKYIAMATRCHMLAIHKMKQVAQLSQRDRAAGWVSFEFWPKVEDDILQTYLQTL